MEQYVKGFKGFTPVKMCGLSPLASFYVSVGLKCVRQSSTESFSNLSPFYTVVSKNVVSVPELSYFLSTDLPY